MRSGKCGGQQQYSDLSIETCLTVRAVLGLGGSLGIRVVAEGVETEAQMRVLIGEGCAEMQGYLFGKPQPVAQLATAMAGEGVFAEAAG